MLQRFENFKKNKDKNINKVNIEYDLYDFNFKTIYTGHQFESLINLSFSNFNDFILLETIYTNYGCIIFRESNFINSYVIDKNKNYIQALALISYIYNFRTKSE